MKRTFVAAVVGGMAALTIGVSASAWAAAASGPLRILPANPRYFSDGTGRAIYLAGSHKWQNLQDHGHRLPQGDDPPPVFDYGGYLDFLAAHHHNFIRLWRWETPRWADAQPKGVIKYCRPHPWVRSGPGLANDGKPKFDLTRFEAEYFDRLRERVRAAGERGIYVSVMLFEGWQMLATDAWTYHPFHADNNVNGVEGDAGGDGRGLRYHSLQESPMGKRVLALQESYVRRVIDSLNDLDNVLYEICNESGDYSTAWQYHMIRYVKQYEAAKLKQHPVGMTVYRTGTNEVLYKSPADWISPNPGSPQEAFRDDPTSKYLGKVIINDTDHLWGHTGGDNVWVWKSFCRGLNVLFMEDLTPSPTWQDSARAAMGQTRRYAEKVNLAAMTPQEKLSATKYCLAERGKQYLVFQPGDKGEFTVDLRDAVGEFAAEWLNVNADAIVPAKAVRGGGVRTFATPFPGPAVLCLISREVTRQ